MEIGQKRGENVDFRAVSAEFGRVGRAARQHAVQQEDAHEVHEIDGDVGARALGRRGLDSRLKHVKPFKTLGFGTIPPHLEPIGA